MGCRFGLRSLFGFVVLILGGVSLVVEWSSIQTSPGSLVEVKRLSVALTDTRGLPATADNLPRCSPKTEALEDKLTLCSLNTKSLVGQIPVNMTSPESLDSIGSVLGSKPPVTSGGRWRPRGCRSKSHLAVVMTYRNRTRNLKLILQHLHPFLQKQLIEYQIFVIEPDDKLVFNRGILKNIGFMEAMGLGRFKCVVFQDLDLLPEIDRNLYHCSNTPRHLVVAIDTNNYKPLYAAARFGGAVLFQMDTFKQVNGYSNWYFDWGAEDDDLKDRVNLHRLGIARPSKEIGRYKEARHSQDPHRPAINKILFKLRRSHMYNDGLNSLSYQVLRRKCFLSHTWVHVTYDESKYKAEVDEFAKRRGVKT